MRPRNPGPPSLLDALVPEELRAAYRLLKNAGCLPPELESSAEMRELERLLRHATTGDERHSLLARMNFLLSRRTAGARHLRIDDDYFIKVTERLNQSPQHRGR